jgi:dUTP pyrophosphatase
MAGTLKLRYRKLVDNAIAPEFAHGAAEDAGMDLYSSEAAELPPMEWRNVGTGICIEIPPGYEGQLRPRSGLARRHGLTLLNSPATIDPGYRGELRVTLINFGRETYQVRPGDRIAQLVIASYASVRWELAESLGESQRGRGGFGSTGR